MSRWRVTLVVVLLLVPFVFWAGVGSYFLWREGLARTLWWPAAACWVLGYVLAWHWQRKQRLLRPPDFTPDVHWTERDRQAWQVVEARARTAIKIELDTLGDLNFYASTAQELAQELARFYHPGAQDPVGSLTIPELLAVVELAAHDLAELADRYLPAGHLLTINNWRQARQATDWYRTISTAYWLISAAFAPVNTAVRYATSQAGMTRPWQLLQENLVAWFYAAYIQRLGTYLIELNSGRLRVGVRRYRELMAGAPPAAEPAAPAPPEPAKEVQAVTVTVMGQVKAGKSSLINAVLGEQRALADVLPATEAITRYELQPPGVPSRLVFLDTVGYGHSGPREDQLRATEEAARTSDLLLLVLHARNPARKADVEMVEKLRAWFAARPGLKMPPLLGVMTQIDLLSPALEWDPPYNWLEPRRPKERQIHEAWLAVRDQVGQYLVGIVPLCTAPGKVYGIEEWFLPTVAELLDEARAVALLRCLRAEADAGKVRKVFAQLLQAGAQAARVWFEQQRK